MKHQIKIYKHIRKRPLILGLSIIYFLIWFGVSIVALMSFVGGFSLMKLIVVLFVIGILYTLFTFLTKKPELIIDELESKVPTKIENLQHERKNNQ